MSKEHDKVNQELIAAYAELSAAIKSVCRTMKASGTEVVTTYNEIARTLNDFTRRNHIREIPTFKVFPLTMDEGDRGEDDNEAQRGPVEEDERPREEMPSDEEINAMYEATERPQTEKEAYEHAH